jgi:hypothetical protein
MYEALRPNLNFKARRFDDYLIELAQEAERLQLPTVTADGSLAAFKPSQAAFKKPELDAPRTEAQIASAALVAEIAKEHLTVACGLCMREETFHGTDKPEAVKALRKAGWRVGYKGEEQERIEVCSFCVWKRAPKKIAA